jgi:hypothetical protein
MPFTSQAQRGFMYSQHPDIAKEFEAKTPKGKKLPYKVSGKKPKGKSDYQMEAMKKKIKK